MPAVLTLLRPSDPCPCCGGELVGDAYVAYAMGVEVRRIHGWLADPVRAATLPLRRPESAEALLWCRSEVERWAKVAGEPMIAAEASKWSKQASHKCFDASGTEVAWADSTRIRVWWRVDDEQCKRTFTGPNHRSDAQRLIDDVAVAHRESWAKNESRRPVDPADLAAVAAAAHKPKRAVAKDTGDTTDTVVAPSAIYNPQRTIAAVIGIKRAQILDSSMPKTQRDTALSALAFIQTFLVYTPDHAKLDTIGAVAGDSFLLDDVHGLSPADLRWFVKVRRTTNLSQWETYRRHVAKWEKACAKEAKAAAKTGREPVMTAEPEMPVMTVTPRTERFTWQILDQVLEIALDDAWIARNPYTKVVRDLVGTPEAAGAIVALDVLEVDEVLEICAALRVFEVEMRNPDSFLYEQVSGAKFALFVEVRGRLSLRSEEGVALFDADFMDLDTSKPFLRVSGAEPHRPAD